MKSLLTLLATAALISVMVVGCAKKPKVEPMTQPGTTETKPPDNPVDRPIDKGENVESGSGSSSMFNSIYFDFDRYNLREDAKSDLKKNIAVMQQDENLRITIEGHCDERGTVEYNLALGERRAKSARDYMVSMGVQANRISTISYGKERPFAFGHDEDSWAKNRRDDFVEK